MLCEGGGPRETKTERLFKSDLYSLRTWSEYRYVFSPTVGSAVRDQNCCKKLLLRLGCVVSWNASLSTDYLSQRRSAAVGRVHEVSVFHQQTNLELTREVTKARG